MLDVFLLSGSSSVMASSPTRNTSVAPASPAIVTESEGFTKYEIEMLAVESFSKLYSFYKEGILCDVIICVGDLEIPCHRVVLATISMYFKTMFTSEMSESHEDKVHIRDIDECALKQIIEFAYTAKIRISVDTVQQLFYASSILQVINSLYPKIHFFKISQEIMKHSLHNF